GVTANCIAPGLIATAMTDKLSDKQRETILARVPAGRLGAGADVAAAAGFLGLQEGRHFTRPNVDADGGDGDDLTVVVEAPRGSRRAAAMLVKAFEVW